MLLTAALAAGAVACTPAVEEDPQPQAVPSQVFLTPEEAQQEYRDTLAELQLPSGYSFPEKMSSLVDSSDSYEQGVGAGDAVHYWYCSWVLEWLRLRVSSPEAAEDALQMIAAVQETETYQRDWDYQSIQVPFEEGLAAAQLGDPTYFQRESEANCSGSVQ